MKYRTLAETVELEKINASFKNFSYIANKFEGIVEEYPLKFFPIAGFHFFLARVQIAFEY